MRIFVDADACPVKEIIVRCAKQYHISVVMVADTAHHLEDGYSQIIIVDKAKDSADLKLINLVQKGDIVVTQDYGVGAMALAKGARALDPNGRVYHENNIEQLLFERHVSHRLRKAKGRLGGIGRRRAAQDQAFEQALIEMLEQHVPKNNKTD